ncbi:MAG TPA: hypothetical protein VGK01_11900 [Candidatus Angelobacter sp.]|jgi:hypothetical protein
MAKLIVKSTAFCVTLLLAILAVGCGGGSMSKPAPVVVPVITASQVFSNSAETWTFKNGYGDLTTIEVQPQPDGSTVWHYTKNADRAYWQPGIQSELYFRMELDGGQWYSPDFRVIFPSGCPYSWCGTGPVDVTIINTTTPGMPRPYLIIGNSGTTLNTSFTDFGTPNTRWETKAYTEQVDTPVFSGFALVSEQWEGPCTHEKWYFAPGKGLIKVIPADLGNCQPADPLLTMVRVLP